MELEDVSLCDLPFELLEIIFEYLSKEDLKVLINFCNRLRDVIIASSITMRKLKLTLNEDWMENQNFVEKSGKFVKILDFDYCNFEVPEEFLGLIKLMRNIESLKLANIHLNAEIFNKKFKILAIKLNKLMRLDLDNSQAVGKLVRLYLKKLQVKHLRLDFSHYNVTDEFVKLLWSQQTLDTLELSGFNNILYQSLFKHNISYMIRFPLKRLILNHRVTYNEFYLEFFKVLVSLESLEVYKEVETQEFFNVVFAMENLRSLALSTNFVTLKNIDFKKVGNSKIEELILVTRNQYGIEQTINYLAMKLLMLRKLKVVNIKTDSSDQMLAFVHLKKLESLHIDNSKVKFLQNIKLDNLQSLHLTNIHPFLKFEDWENFFKNNPKISTLILSHFEVYYVIETIKSEIDKIIYNLHYIEKSLKHLEIYQELRYQKPMKVYIDIGKDDKIMKVSDSFIKICREEFHLLRKMKGGLNLSYYADEYFEINNKYLK
ncbi:CLUMA_CG015452, isoform A [Clunio marinus]|uniref:CLUMA_CG015452, isoform A n=1 Tax=Clunio marinus TaxID=568069 RepID=A0A1J1ISC7_9DIPT|nr:CLUMA_CG015452, isoform A [Clunio marinus]